MLPSNQVASARVYSTLVGTPKVAGVYIAAAAKPLARRRRQQNCLIYSPLANSGERFFRIPRARRTAGPGAPAWERRRDREDREPGRARPKAPSDPELDTGTAEWERGAQGI